ncbi:YeeE/YedE family protein [Alkalibacter rhizosphaerae]|uniref:YeeE/YedE family protein n=1 Tax=Alkalibacter rhizosphaerae TaxID=2815577 RepID=A0A975AHD1_9FIRM|nr:YeeE/YedE thiosulfate transporter family protein [Alkalibacter rhizosphaerae]QSX07883.1 YeeE/YedE family protein [Alkalibacter rhizosphaerae]
MDNIKNNQKQLFLGLAMGVLFGFFLQKGGVTKYDIIMAQLRLTDFTVLKIMLSAVIVTMLGISILYPKGKIKLSPKGGSIRNAVIGGLIFGIGFGTLGYCPGTIAGAVGNGSMDGLLGGLAGIVLGSGLFASMYSTLKKKRSWWKTDAATKPCSIP